MQTSVLVAGGGPVGLVLAMDLAQRGIAVTVVETRAPKAAPSPKCNHVAARSMEFFRRLGIAEVVRDAGLPHDHPHDVCFRTSVAGRELSRIPIPARALRGKAGGPDTQWPTPEPPHRINQIFLEPLLQDCATTTPGLTLLHRTELVEFSQDAEGVTATLRDLETQEMRTIRAAYLVGCDGGRSMVRRAIGGRMVGDAVVQRVQSTYIRAPGLHALLQSERSWMTLTMNPRRCGNTIAINGTDTFLVHNYFYAHETDFDAVDRDASLRELLGVGPDFQYEILSNEDWIGRRLVADKLREGRVFLAGDSAHIWVPYGGYGMNAGIGDAMVLAAGRAPERLGAGGDPGRLCRRAPPDHRTGFPLRHGARGQGHPPARRHPREHRGGGTGRRCRPRPAWPGDVRPACAAILLRRAELRLLL